MSISLIIEQSSFKQVIIAYGLLCISILFALSFNYINYINLFISVMRIVTINSLISYFIAVFFPSLIQLTPTLVNSAGTTAHVVGASFVVLSGDIRNGGIFWEPGAFQTFLVMAALIEFHDNDNSMGSKKFIFIYMFALLTTLSTTGFVSLVLLVIYIIFSKKHISAKLKYISIAFLALGLLVFFIRNNPYLQYAFIDKLKEMFNPSTTYGTARVRQDSIIFPTQKFLESPLFGVGAAGLGELEAITGHTMYTFTPINWYAKWGILYGSIMIIGLWKYTKFLTSDIFRRIFILGIILVSVSTEEFSSNPSFLIYPLLGLFSAHVGVRESQ
jgi:hypothetical protein